MIIDPVIIETGSRGNCIVYDRIIVDMGVSYKKAKEHIKDCKYLFLTHEHGDHFNKNALIKINDYRPDILIIAPYYLKPNIEELGLRGIMYIKPNISYEISNVRFVAYELIHNVLNVGYSFEFIDGSERFKVFHATDTYSLDGIDAKGYDLYSIELNHDEDEIEKDIIAKTIKGEYAHEVTSSMNHMSFQRAQKWLDINFEFGKSRLIPLHISSTYKTNHVEEGSAT